MTGADLLVKCLKEQGVEVIFGIPGAQLCDIYAALSKNKGSIKHITARHECGASLMAVGYARSTNKPGVCLTIPGPGASNAYTGILEAYTACDPILLITAIEEAQHFGKDPAKIQHGFDQKSAFYPVTKFVETVATVEEIPEAVDKAFEAFRSGRPKPVLLEITCQALAARADLKTVGKKNKSTKAEATKEQLKQAIDLLKKARRPFILAGRGIAHANASNEMLEFAKLLKAPVATTALGKGAISEDDSLSIGCIKTQLAKKVLADSDIIIAIGTRFVQTDTENWTLKISQPLIHIEADAEEINKEYKSDVGIAGDPKLVLKQLIKSLKDKNTSETWDSRFDYFDNLHNSRKKIDYLEQIRQAMAPDAILCVDVHWLGYTACKGFKVYEKNTFLHSPISMTLGFALPAAIGAKVAFPDRQVVVFCGDGGFLLSSPEFATIMKYNLGIVIILINDNAYGTIKEIQKEQFGKNFGVELFNPDFIKYAESFGAHGFRISGLDNIKPTLEKALKLNKPVIVDVMIKKSMKGKLYDSIKKAGKYLKFIS
jgi:acetolactate synthase I/II/III large subunit